MKQLLHDTPSASLIIERRVKLNHGSYAAELNLLFDKKWSIVSSEFIFFVRMQYGLIQRVSIMETLIKKNHAKIAIGNL